MSNRVIIESLEGVNSLLCLILQLMEIVVLCDAMVTLWNLVLSSGILAVSNITAYNFLCSMPSIA